MPMMKASEDVTRFREVHVPPGRIALWWLGQAGFVIKTPAGVVAAIDPYLSNSCKALGEGAGFDMDRMVPPPLVPAGLAGIDLYCVTHSHQDHVDPETVGPFLAADGIGANGARFVAPAESVEKLASLGVPPERIEMTWPNKTVTVGDLSLRATFAIPFGGDDLTHVGYLVSIDGGPRIYFTGDTAYHDLLVAAVAPHRPDVLVAVINGAFRNMGPADAATHAARLGVKVVIPCHHDLFRDNMQPPQMLRTNLRLLEMDHAYRPLKHGEVFMFPEFATSAPESEQRLER